MVRLSYILNLTVVTAWIMVSGCGHKTSLSSEQAAADPTSVIVRAEHAEVRNIDVTIDAWGSCTASPQHIATIMPAVEGQVEKIIAKPGDKLTKGQAILQLDDRIARANLAEKTANRDGLKASLSLLKAPPRPEELLAQESAVQQAKIVCDKAQSTLDHLRPLLTKGEIPAVQVHDAEATARQAVLQYEAAQAQLTTMKLGPRTEAVAEAEARVKTADALVDSAKAQLDLLTLRSPIDGVLEGLACQLGETISVGTALGNVVDARQLLVTAWLPAQIAGRSCHRRTGTHRIEKPRTKLPW